MNKRKGGWVLRLGLVLTMAAVATVAAAERRVDCTFDRMTGFNALEDKIERTRADTISRWSTTEGEPAAEPNGPPADQGGEIKRFDTPETLNWVEIGETGGITVTTVYKQVRRSPGRFLASQSRTAPLATAGATPTLSIGACRVEPPF